MSRRYLGLNILSPDMMDQNIINWVAAFAGALGGWILKILLDAMQDLKRDIKKIEQDFPETYVRKDYYKDIVEYIKEDMRERFDKIDTTMALIYKKFDEHIDKGS